MEIYRGSNVQPLAFQRRVSSKTGFEGLRTLSRQAGRKRVQRSQPIKIHVMLGMTRTHAITTPKSCQDRKVAAIRDARDRRELRVFCF